MKNILVTSLGTSWAIIPELIGFTNPVTYDFYKNHPQNQKISGQRSKYGIEPINELWVVTTNGEKVGDSIEELKLWLKKINNLPEIKLYSYTGLKELNTVEEIPLMRDLVYRTVLHARTVAGQGKLFLSLAGGRKNMSADMQDAAYLFGCDALLHLMDNRTPAQNNWFRNDNSFDEIPDSKVRIFYPVILQDKIRISPLLFAGQKITADNYPLKNELEQDGDISLYQEITRRRRESANSLLNIYKEATKEAQTNYKVFQLLSPEIVEKLHSEKIALDKMNKKQDLKWLRKLPKADLHCHFGGILSPAEMIEVAAENKTEVENALTENHDFKKWFVEIKNKIDAGKIDELLPFDPKKKIREYWNENGIKEPLAISAFLWLFEGKENLLKQYIYNNTGRFKGIGIEHYEKLGDLQGSSLMQNEKSIRKACRILKKNCREHNIQYLELRCSPVNYTRGELSSKKVVQILTDELKDIDHTLFKLIFIASRHGDGTLIKKHIDLALKLRKEDLAFSGMFVGFDLAGAESAKSPGEMRKLFLEILEESIPTTIHAGEDMDVKNIWEAVYHLSAERIGHGLTLNNDDKLKERIKERKIAIELCPSSNDQIIGYKDYCQKENHNDKEYPLKKYLREGLKITINTDDPGMSLTNLTNEYYKAACLVRGGLSKWEILQINRNGFKYAFMSLEDKKKILLEVESEIFKLLNNEIL